jgi:hypothetical protein
MTDRPTPESTAARRVNRLNPSLPRYVVDVEVCEQLERQRDELLEQLTVIRTVASYPHHPNALHAIAAMAKNSIAAVKGDHT